MTFDDIDSGTGDAKSGGGEMALVDLEFATLRRFREEMAPYLNYEGFFVRTEEPFPRGTAVRFRFLLPEGFALAEGTGVVAWNRTGEARRKEEPGMALWFDKVNQQSKEVIDELVDFHIATGGKAFDLGRSGESAGDFPTDALAGTSSPPPPPEPEAAPVAPKPAPVVPEPAPVVPEPEPVVPEPEPAAAVSPEISPGASTDQSSSVLPDWLSEVAQDGGGGPSPEVGVPAETVKIDVAKAGPPKSAFDGPELPDFDDAVSDVPLSRDEELEISLMPEGTDSDPTPFQKSSTDRDVTMAPGEKNQPLTDIRWKPLVAVAVVLGVCAGVLFWAVNRIPTEFNEEVDTFRPAPPAEEPAAVEDVAREEDSGEPAAIPEDDRAILLEEDDTLAADVKPEVPEAADRQVEAPVAARPAEPGQEISTEIPPAADGTATQILDVGVAIVDNSSQIAIRGNGLLLEGRVKVSRLEDPDRVWIRIRGIQTFYRPNELVVGSKEVERVRIGHHPEENPPSIYVVIDLADGRAQIGETWHQGETFRVSVAIP